MRTAQRDRLRRRAAGEAQARAKPSLHANATIAIREARPCRTVRNRAIHRRNRRVSMWHNVCFTGRVQSCCRRKETGRYHEQIRACRIGPRAARRRLWWGFRAASRGGNACSAVVTGSVSVSGPLRGLPARRRRRGPFRGGHALDGGRVQSRACDDDGRVATVAATANDGRREPASAALVLDPVDVLARHGHRAPLRFTRAAARVERSRSTTSRSSSSGARRRRGRGRAFEAASDEGRCARACGAPRITEDVQRASLYTAPSLLLTQ